MPLALRGVSWLNQKVWLNPINSLKSRKHSTGNAVAGAAAASAALLCCGLAAAPAAARDAFTAVVRATLARHPQSVETVHFGPAGGPTVRLVRGGDRTAPRPVSVRTAEIVTFADPRAKPVQILRGESGTRSETIRFADPAKIPVTVIRGPAVAAEFALFAPASAADLDRVAFAVDGAESSHGADPGMWRADLAAPQGPMQVSLAAALDVGGGDRFDMTENRTLGRAYLARLYRRYGNWADAVIAYNWGPAHVDSWIAGGRPADRLPVEVERYRDRVLGAAGLVLGVN
ncbi:MAG TPA: lytic transglycosylase domain-containing protein [Stellaceae bacterium]|nr:lytic transglycosylase domain-containing protein [Stellaceae bacterium]